MIRGAPRAVPASATPHEGLSGLSVAAARRAIAASFRAAGLDTPDLDARILVGHALGLDRTGLAANAERILNPADAEQIAAVAARRLACEPVARIVGVKEFWSLPLRLNAATLVPRPESETVVATALEALGPDRGRPWRIADLGTGSGALLLALLSELPRAVGIGTDRSFQAACMARANAQHLGLQRAGFVVCDWATALGGPFDLVVSNPPYVATAEIALLAPEVREYDPRPALDGGADGLNGYRAIAAAARALLAPGAALVLELGAGQEQVVAALLQNAGLAISPARPDLSGTPRALLARNMV